MQSHSDIPHNWGAHSQPSGTSTPSDNRLIWNHGVATQSTESTSNDTPKVLTSSSRTGTTSWRSRLTSWAASKFTSRPFSRFTRNWRENGIAIAPPTYSESVPYGHNRASYHQTTHTSTSEPTFASAESLSNTLEARSSAFDQRLRAGMLEPERYGSNIDWDKIYDTLSNVKSRFTSMSSSVKNHGSAFVRKARSRFGGHSHEASSRSSRASSGVSHRWTSPTAHRSSRRSYNIFSRLSSNKKHRPSRNSRSQTSSASSRISRL